MKLRGVKQVFAMAVLMMGAGLAHAQTGHDRTVDFTEIRGLVVDAYTGAVVDGVHIRMGQTDIATITNSEGRFLLKVPARAENGQVQLIKVGYTQKDLPLSFFTQEEARIELAPEEQVLEKIELFASKNPVLLVEKALEKRSAKKHILTGFYREKIRRGARRDVMVSEAVLQLDEHKNMQGNNGRISLYKSRKNTDYKRLDTMAVKLKGGPYNPLYIDALKYPEFLFYEGKLENYHFEFKTPTTLNNRYVFVIYFEDRNKQSPWYYGDLFIDAKTNALLKVDYHLNVDNTRQAERMLVAKKPNKYKVTPLEVSYQADYLLDGEESYYSYGKFYIRIRINQKGKLFNFRYSVDSELMITDKHQDAPFPENELKRVKPSTVIPDDITGFGDPGFWGENNIIEPEKPLQRTFDRIWRQYQRSN